MSTALIVGEFQEINHELDSNWCISKDIVVLRWCRHFAGPNQIVEDVSMEGSQRYIYSRFVEDLLFSLSLVKYPIFTLSSLDPSPGWDYFPIPILRPLMFSGSWHCKFAPAPGLLPSFISGVSPSVAIILPLLCCLPNNLMSIDHSAENQPAPLCLQDIVLREICLFGFTRYNVVLDILCQWSAGYPRATAGEQQGSYHELGSSDLGYYGRILVMRRRPWHLFFEQT